MWIIYGIQIYEDTLMLISSQYPGIQVRLKFILHEVRKRGGFRLLLLYHIDKRLYPCPYLLGISW
jgi:hypothetical protein